MSNIVRTARGEALDMNALRSSNEKTLAVSPTGGRSMNARGDLIGPGGDLITTREDFELAYAQNIENAVRQVPISSDSIAADVPRPTIAPVEPVSTIADAVKTTTPKPQTLTSENKSIDEIETLSLEDVAEQFTEKKTTEEKPKTRRRRTTTKRS